MALRVTSATSLFPWPMGPTAAVSPGSATNLGLSHSPLRPLGLGCDFGWYRIPVASTARLGVRNWAGLRMGPHGLLQRPVSWGYGAWNGYHAWNVVNVVYQRLNINTRLVSDHSHRQYVRHRHDGQPAVEASRRLGGRAPVIPQQVTSGQLGTAFKRAVARIACTPCGTIEHGTRANSPRGSGRRASTLYRDAHRHRPAMSFRSFLAYDGPTLMGKDPRAPAGRLMPLIVRLDGGIFDRARIDVFTPTPRRSSTGLGSSAPIERPDRPGTSNTARPQSTR